MTIFRKFVIRFFENRAPGLFCWWHVDGGQGRRLVKQHRGTHTGTAEREHIMRAWGQTQPGPGAKVSGQNPLKVKTLQLWVPNESRKFSSFYVFYELVSQAQNTKHPARNIKLYPPSKNFPHLHESIIYGTTCGKSGVDSQQQRWHLVGGVAQWFGRRSLTGRLSLICACSMVDVWPLRGEGVRYGSTNEANSASYPQWDGNK